MAKNITKIPLNERPYEKLELLGSRNLTNSELLAIIIKNGTRDESCLQIAQKILCKKNGIENITDLEYLSALSLEELKQFTGIGRVKAIQIHAVIELSKRLSESYINKNKKIISPKDVYDLVHTSYVGKKQEILKTIILNRKNKVISVVTNGVGTAESLSVGIKEILSEPIKQMASSIILVHNHPSGTLLPSKQDINLTKTIDEYSKIFNINLIDHIIISNYDYISLKEDGYI